MTAEIIGACPLDCPDGCSWVVTVEDGVAIKMRGNPRHPFTDGGLCRKVYPWLDYAADPDRLLTPLRRRAPKRQTGDTTARLAAFEPITWEAALAEIADRMQDTIETKGPESIWPFYGTGNMGYLQGASGPAGDRLWNHLGVSDHDLTICSPSGHHGLVYSMGVGAGMDPEEVVDAGLVLIWGSNTLISGQHWWPFVERARARGAIVVVIDPIRTRTAERADHHVAVRAGTDALLALGLAKALIDRRATAGDFLERHTAGFDEFAASIDDLSPDRVCRGCGIDREQFDGLVELLVNRGPLAVKFGHGAQRHAGGGQTARAVSCLPALLGSFAEPGGGLFYSTGPMYNLNTAAAGGRIGRSRPRSLAMTNLVANLERLEPPVDVLFIYGANPVVSNPDTTGVRRALRREGLFTVVSELFATETIDFADIVLPSTMAHEHLDLNDSFAHYYLNLNRPAVAAPGECLPHTEMFRRLATALGIDDPSLQADDAQMLATLVDTAEFRAAGIDTDYLMANGFARLPVTSPPFRPFAERFPTPSGRFEFSSERAERDGHGRFPHVHLAVEAGRSTGEAGVYDLVAAAGDNHINSTFAGTTVARRRGGLPTVAVHPADAARDLLSAGDKVLVHNQRGSFEAVLSVSDHTRRGVASTTKGTWGFPINDTVAERDADMGRGAVFHDNQVQIEPV